MKRRIVALFVWFFCILQVTVSCKDNQTWLSINLSGYEKKEITKSDYTYSSNWDKFIMANDKLMIAYKVSEQIDAKKTKCIDEMIYYLDRNGKILILGRLTVPNGFQNAFGKQFVRNKELWSGSKYMKNELVGFSTKSLQKPFYICGIGRMTNTGELFETEALVRLKIDEDKLSLIEHLSTY